MYMGIDIMQTFCMVFCFFFKQEHMVDDQLFIVSYKYLKCCTIYFICMLKVFNVFLDLE